MSNKKLLLVGHLNVECPMSNQESTSHPSNKGKTLKQNLKINQKKLLPDGESNPGRGGESAES